MLPLIRVLTDDDYLWQKIFLALRGVAGCERVTTLDGGALNVYDPRASYVGEIPDGSITLGVDVPLPFTYAQLIDAIEKKGGNNKKILTRGDRCAYLRGERIPLTEVEGALLDALMDRSGEFISRAELMDLVWHGEAECGVLNVYVHYLRQKLERGEKIIISSRSEGYKIDGRFI
ncbi:MAG: winged helix-turn-helix transcriptional regulator [Clostridia bacterium]|nr:winged helix-turn-helix transcriptional regulator [Clostridia bacterium]